jgi:hypothetical protein
MTLRKEDATKMEYPRPNHQEIAARAYHLYLERGRLSGHEVDDWLQAEYELMQLPLRKLAEIEPPPLNLPGKPRKRSIIDVVHAAMY